MANYTMHFVFFVTPQNSKIENNDPTQFNENTWKSGRASEWNKNMIYLDLAKQWTT
jgi:hypothetical protein